MRDRAKKRGVRALLCVLLAASVAIALTALPARAEDELVEDVPAGELEADTAEVEAGLVDDAVQLDNEAEVDAVTPLDEDATADATQEPEEVELTPQAKTIKSISYTPKKALTYTEAIDCDQTTNYANTTSMDVVVSKKSGKYTWYYEYPYRRSNGDKFAITYSDGSKATYVYKGADSSGYGGEYVNEKNTKDVIEEYDIQWNRGGQSANTAWGVGTHYFIVSYDNDNGDTFTCKVPATVVANPVFTISFTPKTAYTYVVGKDTMEKGQYPVSAGSEKTKTGYLLKKLPTFKDGDKLQVKMTSGVTKTYQYSSGKKLFVNQGDASDTIATSVPVSECIDSNGYFSETLYEQALDTSRVHFGYATYWSIKPGEMAAMDVSIDPVFIGDNTIQLQYMGRACAVNLKLINASKPTWSGGSKLPVNATADYKVTNDGYIRVKVNGKWATSDSVISLSAPSSTTKRVTAKKTGTTTLYLLDATGKQVASKTITVYKIAGNKYELQSVIDKNLVLDIQGKSSKNSARMIVYTRNNGKNQQYQFEAKGTNYLIKCVHSGKYVDVQGGGTKKSQAVIQYTKNGGTNQQWKISVDAKDQVTFTCVKSNMCFDVQGGKAVKGAKMIQYPANGGNNQKWILNKK